MGRRNTQVEHQAAASWGESFKKIKRSLAVPPSSAALTECFEYELKEYFRLCCLARSSTANQNLASTAYDALFRVRVAVEESITGTITSAGCSGKERLKALFQNSFFGYSKKQGTSIRMPLATCNPTKLCSGGCYAHDVLDASPNAMVRGVINGWIANAYERGNRNIRKDILGRLLRHTQRGVRNALKEISNLPSGYNRRAFIRFSHVGEIVHYPNFTNALAKLVIDVSQGQVDCIVYTRHKNVSKLDKRLWVVNFTLDPSSMNRKVWVPEYARLVFSAFGGIVSPEADVNFLEHHRHSHLPKKEGTGRICPATLPQTRERSCDACRCKRCFVPV
jgi:hypothetical protein